MLDNGTMGSRMSDAIVFAGTANPGLGQNVAAELKVELGRSEVQRFPDGELSVRLCEPVRRREVCLLQPIAPPVNEHLVELLLFVDACRRAAAGRVTAIIPYLGYSRSDKRHGRREGIAASVVADVLKTVGVDHVITVDLHAAQIEGFFHIPVDNLTAVPVMHDRLRPYVPRDAVVVAPDAGAVHLAGDYGHRLGLPVVVLHKRRETGSSTRVTHLIGDVRDRACLIIDDMISTGGTIAEAIAALLKGGARPEMIVAATHGLFVQDARQKLRHHAVRRVFVTDTVRVDQQDWPQLEVVSLAPLIARALGRLLGHGSFTDLYA